MKIRKLYFAGLCHRATVCGRLFNSKYKSDTTIWNCSTPKHSAIQRLQCRASQVSRVVSERDLQTPSSPGSWGSRPALFLPPNSNLNLNSNRRGGRQTQPGPTSVGSWRLAPGDGSGIAYCQQEKGRAEVWAQVKRGPVVSWLPWREEASPRSGRRQSRNAR